LVQRCEALEASEMHVLPSKLYIFPKGAFDQKRSLYLI